MKILLPRLAFAILAFAITSTIPAAKSQTPAPAASAPEAQVIEVTARRYAFQPSPIHVKQGTRVQLKITAMDHDHGFQISTTPEGSDSKIPGLAFASPQECFKIKKHQTQTIEFTAEKAGTYPFKCCVHCGLHHRSMKGELIVEP